MPPHEGRKERKNVTILMKMVWRLELMLLVLSLPFTFLSSMASPFHSSCRCVRPGSLPGHRTGCAPPPCLSSTGGRWCPTRPPSWCWCLPPSPSSRAPWPCARPPLSRGGPSPLLSCGGRHGGTSPLPYFLDHRAVVGLLYL